MTFPDLPPDRIPGSPGHLNDHQLIDQGLDYIQQSGYRDDPDFPPLPDVPVLGQSGHVTAHDRILAVLQYVKDHPSLGGSAAISNNPTGTYSADGHNYAYYELTSSGTLTVTAAGFADLLIVGGGGGGSSVDNPKSGGGAGGCLYVPAAFLPSGSLPVIVGAGGEGGTTATTFAGPGGPGQPSLLGHYAAPGGGAGRSRLFQYGGLGICTSPPQAGGSGGGDGGAGTTGLGHNGGGGSSGGGGGAGGAGGSSPGGPGVSNSITGQPVTYAAGGAASGPAGAAHTGNGGGGGGDRSGGSGIVIVRIKIN